MRTTCFAVLLVSCYQPTPPEGVACGPDNACPSGLQCELGICVSHPGAGDGGVDIDAPDARPFDAACGACSGDGLSFVPCSGPPVVCSLGCITVGGDHCAQLVPENNIDPSLTATTNAVTVSGGVATFDTNTGAISGTVMRAAGGNVISGIGYFQVTSNGVAMGVFTFASLSVASTGEIRFTGSRSAVFLADGMVNVAGKIDLSGGCYGNDLTCAGPGGGLGSTSMGAAAGGCAGKNGASSMTNNDDGGGGGGGGGEPAHAGGNAAAAMGGAAGGGCISSTLVPLVGGGGGGAGGPGSSLFPIGGGGGGALQITSQLAIVVSGTIVSGGAGGHGGNTMGGSSASAGSGGGGGGGILLEAPAVQLNGTVAANGGGGGGGGNSGVGPGTTGTPGGANATPASGGAGTAMPGPGNGGNGGAGAVAPTSGGDGTNSGGGGGGRGVIHVRATAPVLQGTISPTATTASIDVQ